MKNWTNSLALALTAATLTLTACTDDAPAGMIETDVADVADAPDPIPGDPAVYAPVGWPLEIGDKVSQRRRRELEAEFSGLGSVQSINVVNGRTYGARYGYGWAAGYEGDDFIYEGHFRETVADMWWQHEKDLLPEHLHGRIEYHEAQPKTQDRPDKVARFLERREQMRAEGLLPTPAQRSPGRKR